MKRLNPGSNKALENGCTCPCMDNNHGKGFLFPMMDGTKKQSWIIADDCPLHGKEKVEVKE